MGKVSRRKRAKRAKRRLLEFPAVPGSRVLERIGISQPYTQNLTRIQRFRAAVRRSFGG